MTYFNFLSMNNITNIYNRIEFRICHNQWVPISKWAQYNKSICRSDNEIVKISKDALFENVPNQDLYLSKQHQVIIHGKYIDALDLVNYNTITLIPYEDEVLYNVLMNNHQVIKANNTSVETLDPRSEVARLFKKYVWKSDKKKKTVKTIKK